jgi:hypothetical protein
MPIHAPVLLLLSVVAEVIALLVDDLIMATLGRALGGFEDVFASAAPGKFFSTKRVNMKLRLEQCTGTR